MTTLISESFSNNLDVSKVKLRKHLMHLITNQPAMFGSFQPTCDTMRFTLLGRC